MWAKHGNMLLKLTILMNNLLRFDKSMILEWKLEKESMNCFQLQFTKRIIKLKNATLSILASEDLLIFNFEMFSGFLIPVIWFYLYRLWKIARIIVFGRKGTLFKVIGFRTIFFYPRLFWRVAFCKISPYFIATLKCQRTLWIVQCFQGYSFRNAHRAWRKGHSSIINNAFVINRVYEKGIQWKWLASKSTANLFSAKVMDSNQWFRRNEFD